LVLVDNADKMWIELTVDKLLLFGWYMWNVSNDYINNHHVAVKDDMQ